MLTLTFLGVGSAFAKRNHQSNALVEVWNAPPSESTSPQETLLIDFGAAAPTALHQLKEEPGFEYLRNGDRINYQALRKVFISHLHADHIGGLEEMAWMNILHGPIESTGKPFKPQLLSPIRVLRDLWDTSLKGGLSICQGRYALLQDYFFVKALRTNDPCGGSFRLGGGYVIRPFETDHLSVTQKFDWPSYGLEIVDAATEESVFFSGDTRFDPETHLGRMERAKICFQDVQLEASPMPVHALLDELLTLPAAIRAKMFLYHYGDVWDDPRFAAVEREFAGFARPFKRYCLFE